MGGFYSLSGVVGAAVQDVRAGLKDYVASGRLKRQIAKNDRGRIMQSSGNVTVLYPSGFVQWDDAAQFLSERLSKPVFSFHMHDGDLWMFLLFENGKQTTQFNPLPNYWEELPPEEIERWRGDAQVVAAAGRVSPDVVRPYLVHWDLDGGPGLPARPGDQFIAGEDWQLVDFMRAVGFEFPEEKDGEKFDMNR